MKWAYILGYIFLAIWTWFLIPKEYVEEALIIIGVCWILKAIFEIREEDKK